MSWLSRARLIAWHGLRWRRTLRQIARLPERERPVEYHIVEEDDCPRHSIYTFPDGRIVCHPRDRNLAEKALADRSWQVP